MKKFYQDTNLTCFFQNSELKANQSLTGNIALTEDGFRFEEEARESKPRTRNPKVFIGTHISLVRKQDNTLQFYFKTVAKDADLSGFAFGVYEEIRNAIEKIQL